MSEQQRLEKASGWYLKDQLDFDKRLIEYRYRTLKHHFVGTRGLELGPAEGHMTQLLLDDFTSLTVVEGAAALLQQIPNHPTLTKVHALFEEYAPTEKFDTIILEHILEHIDDPAALLARVKDWLAPDGVLLVGVPNGNSIHRLVAVKMGLLKEPCELNARDHAVGHRRVYTPATLRKELLHGGWKVEKLGGVYFKPLSNAQIEQHWSEEMIEGFYELGKDFPELAAELYAVCRA